MNTSLKWLIMASIVNLAGNSLGTVLAFQRNLPAELGSVPNAQNMLHDFLGLKGTALSAPLSFLLIELVLTILALGVGAFGKAGVGGLAFIGLFYALAQLGEPIVLRQFQPGGFVPTQFIILLVNSASAVAMLVFGIQTWRTRRMSPAATG